MMTRVALDLHLLSAPAALAPYEGRSRLRACGTVLYFRLGSPQGHAKLARRFDTLNAGI